MDEKKEKKSDFVNVHTDTTGWTEEQYQVQCLDNLTHEQVKEQCPLGLCWGKRCRRSALNSGYAAAKQAHDEKRWGEP